MTLHQPTRRIVLVAAAVALFVVTASANEPKTHVIEIADMKFGPAPEDIRVGDVVTWVNNDIFRHTATAKDGSFAVDLAKGESGSVLIEQAGSIAYFCAFHPGMTGELVVTP